MTPRWIVNCTKGTACQRPAADGPWVKHSDHAAALAAKDAEIAELRQATENLLGVIEAHEIDSLDCDQSGNKYCDCLINVVEAAKKLLTPASPGSE